MDNCVHLGSWDFFCDLSGRVNAKLDNPIITVAAVAVPVDLVNPLRTSVRRKFPGDNTKWKYGRLEGLRVVAEILAARDLPVGVFQLHIEDPAKWGRYFDQGKQFVREAAKSFEKVPSFLEPEMTLKMRLLVGACAQLIGRLIRQRHRADVPSSSIGVGFIVDRDFQDEATDTQFRESVTEWAPTSRLIAELGVRPIVHDVRCESEQKEPLLLLPDYIAGVYHHADPRTVLGQPLVTPEEASAAIDDLRRRLVVGRLLFEHPEAFDEDYPLQRDERGNVVQR